jgi:glycosyltransferase involved in cell wall biosynthesis
MHVLYVHQNFPAQFGHIANYLALQKKWRCTFVSETPAGEAGGIEKIQYKLKGGARADNHFSARTFENAIWHCDAVYEALKARPDIQPDLIVGHSGFGSTLFLGELYPKVPIINLFEYFYRPHDPDSDIDFRRDLGWPSSPEIYLRARARNAMIMLDLDNCTLGYVPTYFQLGKFPPEYATKLRVVFDGIQRIVYNNHKDLRAQRRDRTISVGGRQIQPTTRIVTYVSRGFEAMRGFDIFMRSAKRIAEEFPDVVFLVIGADRIVYGGDANHIAPHTSFKDWVLSRDKYDLSKFIFTGRINAPDLAKLLATSDLHIYLTAPFVLSWSMMNAMACGATVLASDTPPVREMIRNGENGLLTDFFNIEELAQKALMVLRDPPGFHHLGKAAEEMIEQRYSMEAMIPQHIKMYEDALSRRSSSAAP